MIQNLPLLDDVKLWIFDCDGVLLDSNIMKTRAFEKALADYPKELTAPFLAFQKTAFGMSRFRTMDALFERYLKRVPEPGEKELLLDLFSTYCRDNYPRQPVTAGTVDLLDWLNMRGVPAYVASGSEQGELRSALSIIGLAAQFRDILGSPRKKVDLVADILALHPDIAPGEALLLGDARADYEAADANGVSFVQISAYGVDPEGMAQLQAQQGFPQLATLADLSFSKELP